MGHPLKIIQFDSDENEKDEQNKQFTNSNVNKTLPSLLNTLRIAAIITAILGVTSLVLEVKFYFQFRFEIYIARLVPTLFSFITLLFVQSEFGRKYKILLTHLYLITILGSVSYVINKIPSLFLYNNIAASLFVLTLSLFFVWEVRNQILVSIYFLILFGVSAYHSNILDFSQTSTFVAILTTTSLLIIGVFGNYLKFSNARSGSQKIKTQLKDSDSNVLTSSDKSLTNFLTGSSIPFFQISKEGKFIFSNPSFNHIMGFKNNSDLNFFEDLIQNDNVKNHIEKKLENKGRLESYRLNIVNKEGKNVVLLMDCKAEIDEENCDYFEGYLRDITLQFKSEKAIDDELKTLRKSKQSRYNVLKNVEEESLKKNNIISKMGHELRTPMNSVLGFLTLIENGLFESEEELKDFSHSAKLSAESLLNLINDIVEISKIEDGTIGIVDFEFNIREEIEKIISVIEPHIKLKSAILVSNVSENIPSTIISDPSKYSQILTNLLNNANEATDGGEIKVFISEEVDKSGIVQLVTSIEVTGNVIPQDIIDEVFNGTIRSEDNDSKVSTSILHLIICKELTSLLNGTISSNVTEGKSSKFVFKIPVKYSLNELEKHNLGIDGNERDEALVVERPKLLLVEDNPISRKVEKKLLEEAGYCVDCVDNGFDAIEKIEAGKFDLVLMDIELKEMSGLETTKKIRELSEEFNGIPIIAVTAHSSMKDREKCLLAGMNDYISKPININFLKMTIDQWLNEASIN